MKSNCGSSPESITGLSQPDNPLNIEWLKCHHGIDKRLHCAECIEEKSNFFKKLMELKDAPPKRIPIYRGCDSAHGCFCSGHCKDILGYRDPIFPGER